MNKDNSLNNEFKWPITREILLLILEDKVSDIFVCELVWERLFYINQPFTDEWISSSLTPSYWSEKFSKAPQIISERSAAVHLTRSIPKDHKQNLKKILNFKGYKINELYPRRTRRATAVNWLIYWSIDSSSSLDDFSKLPKISPPSPNPAKGHFGDPEIK